MTDRKIDLGALDPSRDPLRWERMVRSVATRGAEGARRRRPGPLALQLAAWARPALACAAALALVVWVPAWLRPAPAAPSTAVAATSDATARLAAWAASDDSASPGALLLTLGGDDDSR
jgi:hypothetical protein